MPNLLKACSFRLNGAGPNKSESPRAGRRQTTDVNSTVFALVLPLVVVAESIASSLGGRLVKPYLGENAPGGFDPHSCSSGALQALPYGFRGPCAVMVMWARVGWGQDKVLFGRGRLVIAGPTVT
jgi:hypothetical protein